jgi:hypothetical protein
MIALVSRGGEHTTLRKAVVIDVARLLRIDRIVALSESHTESAAGYRNYAALGGFFRSRRGRMKNHAAITKGRQRAAGIVSMSPRVTGELDELCQRNESRIGDES